MRRRRVEVRQGYERIYENMPRQVQSQCFPISSPSPRSRQHAYLIQFQHLLISHDPLLSPSTRPTLKYNPQCFLHPGLNLAPHLFSFPSSLSFPLITKGQTPPHSKYSVTLNTPLQAPQNTFPGLSSQASFPQTVGACDSRALWHEIQA